jgi:hypothetical protein
MRAVRPVRRFSTVLVSLLVPALGAAALAGAATAPPDKRWRQVGLGAIAADSAGGVYGGQDVVVLAAEFGVRR